MIITLSAAIDDDLIASGEALGRMRDQEIINKVKEQLVDHLVEDGEWSIDRERTGRLTTGAKV